MVVLKNSMLNHGLLNGLNVKEKIHGVIYLQFKILVHRLGTIGQYGNDFKTSTVRLGAECNCLQLKHFW